MPNPRIHEDIDQEVFGESYLEVHKWIDGSFNGSNGRIHWANRHYVQVVLDHFNPTDYPDEQHRERLIEVAKFHILLDWAFYYHRVVLPLTRDEVVRELRSEGILVE